MNHASESKLTFSISKTVVSNKQLTIGNLHLNGEDINVDKPTVWNSTASEYQYKLLFELFMYNSQSNAEDFDRRFVYLQLNCSSTE